MKRDDILRAAKAYRETLPYGPGVDNKTRGEFIGGYEGFIIGAEWRINSVWHNASEIPEYGRTILAICKDGRSIICGPNNSDWVETVGIFWIDNWAYIDDLTPKEE